MNSFPLTTALEEWPPFDRSEMAASLFLESFREIAYHHIANCAEIRALWLDRNLTPDQIRTEGDLELAPPLMIHLFKERDMASASEEEIELVLTSSGTGGQKSKQKLDRRSLESIKKIAFDVYSALGMTSSGRTNYICFTYDPKIANDLGTAFTDELLTSFTERNEVYYALQWNSQSHEFILNERGVIAKLYEFASQGLPVRLLGFPALLHRIITSNNIQVELPPDSWALLGGGWKSDADKEIPKLEFRSFLNKRLGLKEENIRDLYGLVEHGIPYVDCEHGRLHIPNLSRVLIRSPHDLRVLPQGQRGLMQLMCTYNSSYPCFNLLTTDFGIVEDCDCKIGGPTLRVMGRAGLTKHKGCAIKALDVRQG